MFDLGDAGAGDSTQDGQCTSLTRSAAGRPMVNFWRKEGEMCGKNVCFNYGKWNKNIQKLYLLENQESS